MPDLPGRVASCDGSFRCPAEQHIEGCFTGEGHPDARGRVPSDEPDALHDRCLVCNRDFPQSYDECPSRNQPWHQERAAGRTATPEHRPPACPCGWTPAWYATKCGGCGGPVPKGQVLSSAVPGHCVSIDGDWWHEPGKCRGAIDNCDGRCCTAETAGEGDAEHGVTTGICTVHTTNCVTRDRAVVVHEDYCGYPDCNCVKSAEPGRVTTPDTYDCHGCGQPASRQANRCENCERITRQELIDAPIGPHLLADNERWLYERLHRVVHRHAFYDHDCQTTSCKAMHLLNSQEMTEVLHEAYQRGYRDAGGSDA